MGLLDCLDRPNKYDVNYMWDMAANEDKVADKAAKELKTESGKSSSEIEKEMNSHNVAYKIKDETDD